MHVYHRTLLYAPWQRGLSIAKFDQITFAVKTYFYFQIVIYFLNALVDSSDL